MTSEESDLTLDILYNLPLNEIPAAIAQLSPEARNVVEEDRQVMVARMVFIAEQLAEHGRLNET